MGTALVDKVSEDKLLVNIPMIQERLNMLMETLEDNCGSIDFEHRGLRYHIWEFADDVEPVGVETNLRYAGRDEEIEGDYDTILAEHLKKEF